MRQGLLLAHGVSIDDTDEEPADANPFFGLLFFVTLPDC